MSYLEPCWAIMSDIGGHLGLSEALLEPSWAILGVLTPPSPPSPRPRGGGGGRGFPEQRKAALRTERRQIQHQRIVVL